MSVTDVTELARAYKPPAHMVFRFPEYALAQQITEDIAARPAEYSRHASSFTDLQPGYVNAFLNGLRQAIETRGRRCPRGQRGTALDLAWEPVLDLAASIADKPIREAGTPSSRKIHLDGSTEVSRCCSRPLLPHRALACRPSHADTILAILRACSTAPTRCRRTKRETTPSIPPTGR